MSETATPTPLPQDPHDADAHGGHGHHDHPVDLAHHFDAMAQQNATAKLAMWVFLGTELLMFGGLFCYYAVWRAGHFDVFHAGYTYLDKYMGAFNTLVLIASSFTMAWAVRAIQIGRKQLCLTLLSLTFLGGVAFMCVKYVEYSHKMHLGVFIGAAPLDPVEKDGEQTRVKGGFGSDVNKYGWGRWAYFEKVVSDAEKKLAELDSAAPAAAALGPGETVFVAADAPADHADHSGDDHDLAHADWHELSADPAMPAGSTVEQRRQAITDHAAEAARRLHGRGFFQVYFTLTGLHGIHVLIGMALIAWVMMRVHRGDFSPAYNTPVDIVGLYWHLVDLIWIFLFPLLYLIE